MIERGDGSIQKMIEANRCPKCTAKWEPLVTETSEICKICAFEIGKSVEKNDRQVRK
jgi:hypothetical protein